MKRYPVNLDFSYSILNFLPTFRQTVYREYKKLLGYVSARMITTLSLFRGWNDLRKNNVFLVTRIANFAKGLQRMIVLSIHGEAAMLGIV